MIWWKLTRHLSATTFGLPGDVPWAVKRGLLSRSLTHIEHAVKQCVTGCHTALSLELDRLALSHFGRNSGGQLLSVVQ